jgi:hypothetical protein
MNIVLIPSTVYSVYALATGAVFVPQIVCCICIALAVRKIVSTIIGLAVYDAIFTKKFSYRSLGTTQKEYLEQDGYIVKDILLTKAGTTYAAKMIMHPNIIDNGHWSIHAFGNNMCMEDAMWEVGLTNFKLGYNTLLINGPAVGG